MKIKFMAGEMARLHGISKQTLLYYDRIGLLKPREKNETTSYRYYTLEQFEELDVILCLKNLGMKLKEIKGYLDKTSVEDRLDQLKGQEAIIQKRLEQLNRTDQRLKAIIAALDTNITITPFETGIKRLNRRYIISEPVLAPFEYYDLEIAIKKIIKLSLERPDTEMGDFMVFVEIGENGDEIFKKVALETRMESTEFIEAGEYAYIYHKGPYETLNRSRSQLYDHARKSGCKVAGATIEKGLLGSFAVASDKEYLIELQVPVKRRQP